MEESQKTQRAASVALVDMLEKAGVRTLSAVWSGGGDEGELDNVECLDANGLRLEEVLEEGDLSLYDALQAAADAHGFNYYDGAGGRLEVTVDVQKRHLVWVGQVPVYEDADWASDEYVV